MKQPIPRDDVPALIERFQINPIVADALVPIAREASTALVRMAEGLAQAHGDARARAEAIKDRAGAATTNVADAANREIKSLLQTLHEADERLLGEQQTLARRVEDAEVGALAALDRDALRDELARARSEMADLRTKHARALKQEEALAEHVKNRKAAGEPPDSIEFKATRRQQSNLFKRTITLSTALSRAERACEKVETAWCVLRQRERDHRVAEHGKPQQHCRWCEVAIENDALGYCSDKHRRLDGDSRVKRGRQCACCGRRFESSTPRVRVFDEMAWGVPTAYQVDVCSLPCWRALIVDEDEPPSFDGTTYLGPVTRSGHARQAGTAGASPTPPAVQDTADRIDELLRQAPDGLTEAQIVAQTRLALTTVQSALAKLAREGRVIGGGRGGRWRSMTTTTTTK